MSFELRTGKLLRKAIAARGSWLPVAAASFADAASASLSRSAFCTQVLDRKARADEAERARREADRAKRRAARLEARRLLAANKTLRCASGQDWREPISTAELAVAFGGRPACPSEWPQVWRQRVKGRLLNGGCCTADASTPIYDPCDAPHGANGGGTHRSSHFVARRAMHALRQRRVLIVGDSLSNQFASALALDLHARGANMSATLLHATERSRAWRRAEWPSWVMAHHKVPPSAWCGSTDDWIIQPPSAEAALPRASAAGRPARRRDVEAAAALNISLAFFSYRKIRADLVPTPAGKCDKDPIGPRHPVRFTHEGVATVERFVGSMLWSLHSSLCAGCHAMVYGRTR